VKFVAYFDGAARGKNPGPAACATVIYSEDKPYHSQRMKALGHKTNNEAEWAGLVMALEVVREMNPSEGDEVSIYGDSKLVVMQALNKWRIKESRLFPYWEQTNRIGSRLRGVGVKLSIAHVHREMNTEADALVTELLDDLTNKLRR
jgi:ribonuclease HI